MRADFPEGKQRRRAAEGVYEKANGKYLATYRNPAREQKWREFPTKAAAVHWRAQGLVDPRSHLSGKRTLEEVWLTLLEHHASSLRPSTRANWEQEWRAHIGPVLARWPVGKITTIAVKDFMAGLEKRGVGAPTRAKCRSILHRILEEAVENGEIPTNPAAARGTRVKLSQPRKARVLTASEVGSVLAVAGSVASPVDALAIEAMFYLGLRIGEMAGLQVRDFDVNRRELTIQRTVVETGGHVEVQDATKTSRARVLRLPPSLPLLGKLQHHVKSLNSIAAAPLFPAVQGGPIRPNNWRRRVWGPVMVAAKIQDPPTPHSGRRTTASLLSEAGVPPATVQAILGHRTLAQTGEYIDVHANEMELALTKLADHHAGAS